MTKTERLTFYRATLYSYRRIKINAAVVQWDALGKLISKI